MAISASMVKELRERTGLGMMECKKALQEVDGDIETSGSPAFGARMIRAVCYDPAGLRLAPAKGMRGVKA